MISLVIAAAADISPTAGPAGFFGYLGVAMALVFANLGAAYGTAKSGVGIVSVGVLKPDLIIKCIIPVVMAGILGIYGLIVSVILIQKSKKNFKILVEYETYNYYKGFGHLAAGMCCGLSSLVNFFK